MPWDLIIKLIAQYGLPLAEELWKKWTTGKPPTEADWAALRALASQSAVDRAKARLTAAGIALDSEQGKLLLSLVV